jgi:membrane protein required for colicin V production
MSTFPAQPYDILMLAVLLLCILFGAWKGMAWQIAALASIGLSALVAANLSGPLAPLFSDQVPWNRCIAMLVLYVVTSLGVWIVFRMVARMINRVQLKEFDRQLGGLFGGVKGVLWCIVITFFAVTLSESARQTILHTRSGYYIAVVTERGATMLPQEVRAVLGKYIEELDRKLDPTTPPSQPPHASGVPIDRAPAVPEPRFPTGRLTADEPDDNRVPDRVGEAAPADLGSWLR